MTKNNEKSPSDIMRDAQKQYDKLPDRKPLEQNISREGAYSTTPMFTPRTLVTDGAMVLPHYHKMLEKKRLKDDKQLLDDIVKYRELVLKHRISCKVTLKGEKGETARITVFEVLVETGQEIVNWWHNKAIDPTDFAGMVQNFRSHMGDTVRTVTIDQEPISRFTAVRIETTFIFT